MLALVKAGMMDKMTNKRVNKWLNIAVRWSVRSQYYCTILHQTVTSSFVFRTRLRHRLPTLMACVVSKMHAAEVAEGISSIQPSQPPHHLNLTRDTRTTIQLAKHGALMLTCLQTIYRWCRHHLIECLRRCILLLLKHTVQYPQ